MRISYISYYRFYPDMRDGASLATFQLLQFLGTQGNDVLTISLLPDSLLVRKMLDFDREPFPSGGASRETRWQESMKDGVRLVWGLVPDCCTPEEAAKLLFRSARERGVDLAILNDDDLPALLTAVALDIPSAHVIHSAANVDSLAQTPLLYRRIMGRRPTFAVSRHIQDRVEAKLGLRVPVWHPWIDLSRYSVGADRPRHFAVGYVSAGGSKGDSIVNLLIERLPDVGFVVAGERYLCTSDRLPGNLAWLGQVSDMREFYSRIDVLLVPSLVQDAFPRVTIEAAVNGIPAIANRVGGIPETLGESGVLIDIDLSKPDLSRVADQYALAIRKLLGDPEAYVRESGKSTARAAAFAAEQKRVSLGHIEACTKFLRRTNARDLPAAPRAPTYRDNA